MSLRYAILAILRVGALSGYDLQKQFSQSVGHVWHAPDSQIYPELAQDGARRAHRRRGADARRARHPAGVPRDPGR
ncbi:PadR family transcriptional regulator [Microbacterium elymi]|uniref:PadR family transcriptional regulator n=1 Tax=Microbacterium elymi TaxID=2909587 RepID=UPI00338F439A